MTSPESVTDFAEKMVSLALGAIGTYLALRAFYEKKHNETVERLKTATTKEYAAQRDFEHLRRNQENIGISIKLLDDELKETREDFLEIKGMLMVVLNRVNFTDSGILGHKPQEKQ